MHHAHTHTHIRTHPWLFPIPKSKFFFLSLTHAREHATLKEILSLPSKRYGLAVYVYVCWRVLTYADRATYADVKAHVCWQVTFKEILSLPATRYGLAVLRPDGLTLFFFWIFFWAQLLESLSKKSIFFYDSKKKNMRSYKKRICDISPLSLSLSLSRSLSLFVSVSFPFSVFAPVTVFVCVCMCVCVWMYVCVCVCVVCVPLFLGTCVSLNATLVHVCIFTVCIIYYMLYIIARR
jgi:hypothetical protein